MKVKPTRSGNVLVEIQPTDAALLAKAEQATELGQIRRILVPVDFSPNSRKAVDYASAFAKQFGATLTFLHVVQLNYAYGEFGAIDFTAVEREMRAGAEKELAGLISAAAGTDRATTSSSASTISRAVDSHRAGAGRRRLAARAERDVL